MKVLVSAFRCSDVGGSEACVGYNWVRELAKRNEVSLITSDEKYLDIDRVSRYHIPIHHWRLEKLIAGFMGSVKPHYFLNNFKAYIKYKDLVKQQDLYHHITPIGPRYPDLLCAKAKKFIIGPVGGALNVPNSFSSIEKKEPIYFKGRKLDRYRFDFDPFLKYTYEKADIIFIVGSYMLDILPERYHFKTRKMIDVGISEIDYPMSKARNSNKKVEIIYVGRIVPYKGLEFLIKAVSNLRKQTLSLVNVNIVGKGSDYEDYCKNLVHMLGIESHVRFHGKKKKGEVLDLYRQMDIFCFPTLSEAGGTVLVEAMACGLPVISVNRGGPVEIVGDGGFLIEPVDEDYLVHEITEKLEFLVNHPEQRRELGERARKYAFANHTWCVKGQRLQKFYEELFTDRQMIEKKGGTLAN